jgi:UDP-GlcNAc:undecaprenyl-phosphate/decaprenyl-phosphate GlcNAc-1-phosphate transferase
MTFAGDAGVGFGVALAVSLVATPAAIRLARRTAFYDHPRGYRLHSAPTPFLGGAAVLAAFLFAALALGHTTARLVVLLICAVGLWLLGTIDDGLHVAPRWRLLASGAAGLALYLAGMGWNTAGTGVVNLPLTILWTVGLVNAFNLMDNLDGVCGAVAAISGAGIGIVAGIKGQPVVAGLAFALSGACAGFLPWNMTRPARIFLGDGGSMPIGFLVATLAMLTANNSATGRAGILLGGLLVGLPMLDVTLVSLSRIRRGVSLMTGGRDHMTHRLLLAVRSPRQVAIILAASQGLLCGLAIAGYELNTVALVVVALASFVAGVAVILLLDTERWRPAGIAYGPLKPTAPVEPATAPATAESG